MSGKKDRQHVILYLLFIALCLVGFAFLVRAGILWFLRIMGEYMISNAFPGQ